MSATSFPLAPKNLNGPLRVLVLGRVSTSHQNVERIGASRRFVVTYLKEIYDGEMKIEYLAETANGIRTIRASIVKALEEMATGTWDLVIAESLSRIDRNPANQHAFLRNAMAHKTRVICIGDNLDTTDETWEVMLGFAAILKDERFGAARS